MNYYELLLKKGIVSVPTQEDANDVSAQILKSVDYISYNVLTLDYVHYVFWDMRRWRWTDKKGFEGVL